MQALGILILPVQRAELEVVFILIILYLKFANFIAVRVEQAIKYLIHYSLQKEKPYQNDRQSITSFFTFDDRINC